MRITVYYEVLVKEDEKRVFFFIYEKKPKEGEPPVPLPMDKLHAYAPLCKADWEAKNGITLYNFLYDPMAGGMSAKLPPTGQTWRPYVVDGKAAFNPASGPKLNPEFEKLGKIEGNLRTGNDTMLSRGLYVGEYL